MSPLYVALLGCLGFAASCWIASIVTREYSWVDRLWSILPPLYVGWFVLSADRIDARLLVMAALAGLWGGRLTYNFARKGGYRPGGEDYRWAALRKRVPPAMWPWFNLLFIAAFQHALLLLIALPAWYAATRTATPFGWLDVVATLAFVTFLIGETLADEQQWRFQTDKHARRARGEDIQHEFLTTGLFAHSRHPNFLCEQAMWWSFYLFSVAAGADWLNASLAGPVLLTLLFQGSTRFTEELTLAKYPSYAEYQQRVPMLMPRLPWDDR